MICASQWVSAGSRRSLRPSIVATRNHCPRVSIRSASLASIIQGLRKEEKTSKNGDLPSWAIGSSKKKRNAVAPWQPDRDPSDVGKRAKSSAGSANGTGNGTAREIRKVTSRKASKVPGRGSGKDTITGSSGDAIKSTSREVSKEAGRVSGRDAIKGFGRSSRIDQQLTLQKPNTRRDSWDHIKTSKALEGSASERQRHKLRRKLSRRDAKQEEGPDDSGRQTRRKRFLDPDSQFGKRSLVYHIKHGDLKDAVNLPGPVRAKQAQAIQDRWCRGLPVEPEEGSSVAKFRVADSTLRKAGEPSVLRSMPMQPSQRFEVMPQGDILELASADSVFVYGRSSVKAALEHGRRKLHKLYMYENRKVDKIDEVIMHLAQQRRVSIKIVPIEGRGLLDRMSVGRPHNGIILESSPLPQLPVLSLGPVEESPGRLGFNVNLSYQSREEEQINGKSSFIPRAGLVTPKPFVLLLNNILDPGNLGALLRSAHYFGIDAVAITMRSSSSLSAAALKAASGAAEEVRLFSVPSSVQFVQQSKMAGWKTYAAVPPPSKRLMELHGEKFISDHAVEREDPLQHSPCLLVLGNEGQGLTKALKTVIDYEVAIPKLMEHTQLDSLNVSVAGALLCHSFVKGSSVAKAEAEAAAGRRSEGVEVDAVVADLAESQYVEPQSERMF
ncbi:spoU rRNA methylase family protein [Hirsutella rhossiliensis]|uniref:rRNA methyltransferase 1, mitochondrial n=1 Tax=Hirsutella rhossiliensis TaxID=111463 RepID=A0A9P8MX77_9HYPO|nr:spoU rRNA methylase family domain-containing protein [Hirsutella rhossiliensis]KAH0961916.1 spoU rRNA methylase family domain-containing protein [Hirsutella rhossiliensis]